MSAIEVEGDAVRRGPKSASERRRASDERRMSAGQTRVSVWLSPNRMAELDAVMKWWGLSTQTEAVVMALRFLAKESPTLERIELPG
jgi:hypothetical protein